MPTKEIEEIKNVPYFEIEDNNGEIRQEKMNWFFRALVAVRNFFLRVRAIFSSPREFDDAKPVTRKIPDTILNEKVDEENDSHETEKSLQQEEKENNIENNDKRDGDFSTEPTDEMSADMKIDIVKDFKEYLHTNGINGNEIDNLLIFKFLAESIKDGNSFYIQPEILYSALSFATGFIVDVANSNSGMIQFLKENNGKYECVQILSTGKVLFPKEFMVNGEQMSAVEISDADKQIMVSMGDFIGHNSKFLEIMFHEEIDLSPIDNIVDYFNEKTLQTEETKVGVGDNDIEIVLRDPEDFIEPKEENANNNVSEKSASDEIFLQEVPDPKTQETNVLFDNIKKNIDGNITNITLNKKSIDTIFEPEDGNVYKVLFAKTGDVIKIQQKVYSASDNEIGMLDTNVEWRPLKTTPPALETTIKDIKSVILKNEFIQNFVQDYKKEREENKMSELARREIDYASVPTSLAEDELSFKIELSEMLKNPNINNISFENGVVTFRLNDATEIFGQKIDDGISGNEMVSDATLSFDCGNPSKCTLYIEYTDYTTNKSRNSSVEYDINQLDNQNYFDAIVYLNKNLDTLSKISPQIKSIKQKEVEEDFDEDYIDNNSEHEKRQAEKSRTETRNRAKSAKEQERSIINEDNETDIDDDVYL